MVPVFVSTNHGQPVFGLKANDFVLTDNGNPQHATLEVDTDSQPLALAIVVETGGAGATHLDDYKELDSILDSLVGNVERSAPLPLRKRRTIALTPTRFATVCAAISYRSATWAQQLRTAAHPALSEPVDPTDSTDEKRAFVLGDRNVAVEGSKPTS